VLNEMVNLDVALHSSGPMAMHSHIGADKEAW